MPSGLTSSRAIAFAIAFAFAVGCNAILDNAPGQRRPSAGPDAVSTAPVLGDASPGAEDQTDASSSSSEASASRCPAGQQTCHGVCVGPTDPLYGCGDPSCAPCAATHGSAACDGTKCILQSCDEGFADCDGSAANGCEADLSSALTCGSCRVRCPAETPACAPRGKSFACGSGCPARAPLLCSNECVAPLTSNKHCGGCDRACVDVAQADVQCEAGSCTVVCKRSHHLCAATCVVDTNPSACGPACVACPVPARATALCLSDACAFQCEVGYGNCNQDATDGCETSLATDALHCGACGASCNGGTCASGACQPVDVPDGGN